VLEHTVPDTFVLATGRTCSVRRFVELAFDTVGTRIVWRGDGIDEVGIDATTGVKRVRINPHFFRPIEVDRLVGDASKVKRVLGWEARMTVQELARLMVEADLARNGWARSA
jgi:GDPmannose 4,6-dehydratase